MSRSSFCIITYLYSSHLLELSVHAKTELERIGHKESIAFFLPKHLTEPCCRLYLLEKIGQVLIPWNRNDSEEFKQNLYFPLRKN